VIVRLLRWLGLLDEASVAPHEGDRMPRAWSRVLLICCAGFLAETLIVVTATSASFAVEGRALRFAGASPTLAAELVTSDVLARRYRSTLDGTTVQFITSPLTGSLMIELDPRTLEMPGHELHIRLTCGRAPATELARTRTVHGQDIAIFTGAALCSAVIIDDNNAVTGAVIERNYDFDVCLRLNPGSDYPVNERRYRSCAPEDDRTSHTMKENNRCHVHVFAQETASPRARGAPKQSAWAARRLNTPASGTADAIEPARS
jgi:hypothetical protein